MHKKEILIIMVFFLLIIFMGIFYFNDNINITGAAITNPKKSGFYGIYSIKPSFKVGVDYDLVEYNKTIENAKILFEECSNHYNLEDCINNKIDEFNKEKRFIWSLNCEKEEENFFYDFIEKYKQCHDSGGKEGICEFSLAEGPKNKNFQIKLSNIEGKTKIELVDKDSLTEIIDVRGIYITDKIDDETGETNKLLQNSADILIFFDEEGKVKKINILAKGLSGEETLIETKNMISLYKDTENDRIFLSFIDNAVYSSFKASKETYKPIKDTFKFCVKSEKQFYIYDEKSKKTELKNIEYKFALRFLDKTAPPPIQNIEIRDKLKDEDSVLGLWDKSPADDVKEYFIFYSDDGPKKEEIKNKETKELISDESIDKIKISENKKIEIEDIDLSTCNFVEDGKPCIYDKYNKPLNKSKLYYWEKEKKYIYVLGNLKDNNDYGFMVVAVDYSGNVINNTKEGGKFILKDDKLPSGKSIDDLKPSYINTVEKKNSEGGKFTLSWDRTIYNLDGSIAYDVASFNIYYKVKDIGDLDELDKFGILINIEENLLYAEPTLFKLNGALLTTEQSNCESILAEKCRYTISEEFEPGKIYLWGVTALDEAENEYEKVFVRYLD